MASGSNQPSKNSSADSVCDTICKLIQDSDASAEPVIDIVEDTAASSTISPNDVIVESDRINDDELDDLLEEQLVLNRIQEIQDRRRNLAINKSYVKDVDTLSTVSSNRNTQDLINDDNDSLFSFMANSGNENDERRYKSDLDRLSKALTLNIVMQSELNKLETYLTVKLKQNQVKQSEVNNEIIRLQQSGDKMTCDKPKSWYAKFGIPYFKDIKKFSCDYNLDVKIMKSLGQMLSLNVSFSKTWRLKEKTLLEKAIRSALVEENSAQFLEQVTVLNNDLREAREVEVKKEIKRKIANLKSKIEVVKKKSLVNLFAGFSPNREFDWFTISVDHVRTHSALECQAIWHLYVKPSVNKAKWTVKEDERLLELVNEYQKQNWDAIAEKLGSSRSAYQCFVNYQTRLNKEIRKLGKWTQEENEALAALINRCKVGYYIPWTKIAYYFQGRSLAQIYSHWNSSLKPDLKKGRFTKQEDKVIVSYVRKFGADFNKISKFLGYRTSVQLRERYQRAIPAKYHNTGRWSLDEDRLLMSLVKKLGVRSWSTVSKQFVTRTRTQVRQRFNVIKKLLGQNPNIELEDISRGPKAMSQSTLPIVPLPKAADQNKENKSLKDLIRQHQLQETLLKNQNNTLMTRIKAGRKKICRRKQIDAKLLNYFKETYTNDNLKLKTQYLKPDVDTAVNAMTVFCQFLQTHIRFPHEKSDDYKKLPVTLRNIALKMQERSTYWGCDCLGSSTTDQSYFCFCQEQTSIDCIPVDLEATLVDDCDYLLNPFVDLKKPVEANVRECKCLTKRGKHFLPYYLPPNIITSIGFRSVLLIKEKIATSLAYDKKRSDYFSHNNEVQGTELKKFTGYFSDDKSSSDEETISDRNSTDQVTTVNTARGCKKNLNCNTTKHSSVSTPSTSRSSLFSLSLSNEDDLMTRSKVTSEGQLRSSCQEPPRRLKEQDAIYLWKERLIAILGWPIVLSNQPNNFSSGESKISEQLTDAPAQKEHTPSSTECLLPEKPDSPTKNRSLNGSKFGVKRKIEQTKDKTSDDKCVEVSYELFADCGNFGNDSNDKTKKDLRSDKNSNCKTSGASDTQWKSLLVADDVLPVEKLSCKKSYTRLKQNKASDTLSYGLSTSFIGLNKVYKCYSRKKDTQNKI